MFISIDVGGTNTRIAASQSLEMPEFDDRRIERVHVHNYRDDMAFIISQIRHLAGGQQIQGVGIGVAGTLNADKTSISYAHNYRSWQNMPIVKDLANQFVCPVFMDNDAVAMGLAETYYGEIEGDCDYIIWGTGIGGATIRYEGDDVSVVDRDWDRFFEPWEMQNGGNVLAATFGKPTTAFTSADWTRVEVSMQHNLSLYCDDNQPKALIFGGGLAVKHAAMLARIGNELGVRLTVTKFGNNAGLVGGFGLIRRGMSG